MIIVVSMLPPRQLLRGPITIYSTHLAIAIYGCTLDESCLVHSNTMCLQLHDNILLIDDALMWVEVYHIQIWNSLIFGLCSWNQNCGSHRTSFFCSPVFWILILSFFITRVFKVWVQDIVSGNIFFLYWV